MFKKIQFLLLLMFSVTVFANVPSGIDSQRLRPSLGLKGMIITDTSEVLDPLDMGVMLFFHYDKAPFVLDKNGEETKLVDNVVYADLVFNISLFKNFELGLDLPLSIFSDGQARDGEDFSGFSLGDLKAGVKYVAHMGIFGVGFTLNAYFPTGNVDKYNSSDDINIQPGLLMDLNFSNKFLVALNASYTFRLGDKQEMSGGVELGNEISYRLGMKYVLNKKVELLAELFGSFQSESPFDQKEETPMETLLAANFYVTNFRVTAGGAIGIVPGVGTPLYRVILGVGYVQRDPDKDNDGILNQDDKCPLKAEDKDGFEDEDGCPEGDNDNDGILDADDKCPLKAEDKDGFKDEDGCPDPDNDNDGFLDGKDKCPNKAETVNGFKDEDGCPEFDTDKDGLFDTADKCPKEAEDKDGFEDEDGCPDLDNDKDGVVDTKDKCPLVPEDQDKFEDEDGCPDPDNDKDGFLDEKDKCPNEPETYNGNKDEDGCPDKGKELVKVDLQTKQIKILKKVFFKTGSHKILRKSYKLLDIVAGTLVNHPEIKKVRVEGHTDDVGRDSRNKKLSQRRADSVMKYLLKKKIAKDRLIAIGYGEEKPMSPYKELLKKSKNRKLKWKVRKAARKELKKARSNNRRVEFSIID